MDSPASQSSVSQGAGGPAYHPGGWRAPPADGGVRGLQVIPAIILILKIQGSTKKIIKNIQNPS